MAAGDLSALGAFGSCASPTQIILHLHTDVPCTGERWKGVDVSVGKPDASLEGKAPAVSTTQCDATGQIGTVVVTPSGGRDEEVGLRIVAGLDRIPEQCNEFGYSGCVVARRAVRFDRNTTLHVDVALARSCIDFGCSAGSTCVEGVCRALTQVPNTPPPEGNAGSGGASQSTARVRCGDSGLFCPVGGSEACCVTVDRAAGTSTGQCVPPEQCPPTSVLLKCDDETDCSDLADPRGFPGLCLLEYTNVENAGNHVTPALVNSSGCFRYHYIEEHWGVSVLALCNGRDECLNNTEPCGSSGAKDSPLPNYSWCAVTGPPPDAGPSLEATPVVRCGDSGLLCPPTGNVCCLTVDSATQTSTGECRPAATCLEPNVVLKCDDASDCPGQTGPDGVPGICALVYQYAQGEQYTPSKISTSECMTYAAYMSQSLTALALCDRSAPCAKSAACESTSGTPNLLPSYHWCKVIPGTP